MNTKERFLAKVAQPAHGAACWTWTAHKTERGYGKFLLDGKKQFAHRVSWRLFRGPVPQGEGYHGTCVLHRCDNPCCVNPDHLFLGTQGDNARDCAAKGRHNRWTAHKTHCHAGHPFDKQNTRIDTHGRRVCRACESARKAKYYARDREVVKAKSREYRRTHSKPHTHHERVVN